MQEDKPVMVTVTISEFGIHVSEPGHPGVSFDGGENNDELTEAGREMAAELVKRYKARNQ